MNRAILEIVSASNEKALGAAERGEYHLAQALWLEAVGFLRDGLAVVTRVENEPDAGLSLAAHCSRTKIEVEPVAAAKGSVSQHHTENEEVYQAFFRFSCRGSASIPQRSRKPSQIYFSHSETDLVSSVLLFNLALASQLQQQQLCNSSCDAAIGPLKHSLGLYKLSMQLLLTVDEMTLPERCDKAQDSAANGTTRRTPKGSEINTRFEQGSTLQSKVVRLLSRRGRVLLSLAVINNIRCIHDELFDARESEIASTLMEEILICIEPRLVECEERSANGEREFLSEGDDHGFPEDGSVGSMDPMRTCINETASMMTNEEDSSPTPVTLGLATPPGTADITPDQASFFVVSLMASRCMLSSGAPVA
jgi:hypothetical protein